MHSVPLMYMSLQLRLTCPFESRGPYLYHSSSRHIRAIHVVSGSEIQDSESPTPLNTRLPKDRHPKHQRLTSVVLAIELTCLNCLRCIGTQHAKPIRLPSRSRTRRSHLSTSSVHDPLVDIECHFVLPPLLLGNHSATLRPAPSDCRSH
jgi:hypothetical protein